MPGLSKVIVLDPDARAGRQLQLGFQREGVPVELAAVPQDPAELALPDERTDLVVVGGTDPGALELVRQVRKFLDEATLDSPIVFAGRGVRRTDAEAAGADEVLLSPAYLRDVVTIGRLLRGQPASHRAHLVGSLAETTGVLTLVRALSALGRSAVLTLTRGLRRGEIRFYHGEVTSAQVGLIYGQAALHQLLLWTDARFDFHHEDIVRRQQIPLERDELFADAERFLAGVRESSGRLSPSMVLEQDRARLLELEQEVPGEVYSVLRMFDGHRVLADVLEDSPYRVFETLRIAQLALEAGLLRPASKPRPRATWRAVLALEEWLVGAETRDDVLERHDGGDSAPVPSAVTDAPSGKNKSGPNRSKGSRRKRKKRRTSTPTASPAPAAAPAPGAKREIDWGALVPRTVATEVGPLAGVVPAAHASGEITMPDEQPGAGRRKRISTETTVFWDEGAEPEPEHEHAEAAAKRDAKSAADADAADQATRPIKISLKPRLPSERGPELAAESEPAAVVSEPAAAVSEPAAAMPEPAAAVSEPAASEPAAVVSEPAAAVSEPAAVVSEPAAAVSEPAAAMPEPAASEPAAVVSEPAAAVSEPAASEPAAVVSEPAAAVSEPAAAMSEPAASEPAAVVSEPAAAVSEPAASEPAAVVSEPAAAAAAPVAPAEPMVTEPMAFAPAEVPQAAPTEQMSAVQVEAALAEAAAPADAAEVSTAEPVEARLTEPMAIAPAEPEIPQAAPTEQMSAVEVEAALAEVAAPTEAAAASAATPAEAAAASAAAPAEPVAPAEPPPAEPPPAEPPPAEPSTAVAAESPAVVAPPAEPPAAVAAAPQPTVLVEPPPTAPQPTVLVEPPPAEPTPAVVGTAPEGAPAAELVDEASDGVIRETIFTADTGPAARRPPPPPIPEDDRPEDAIGEIVTKTGQRPAVEPPPMAEPSILVSDLAEAHTAVAAVAETQAAAPPTPSMATPEAERTVAEVGDDAADAFTDVEEDFFRAGQERPSKPIPVPGESFDDLDEGYRPAGFWDRLLGRKPKR